MAYQSYIERNLLADEKVLFVGHISLFSQLQFVVGGFALMIYAGFVPLPDMQFPMLMMGACVLMVAGARYFGTELSITTRRVVLRLGIVAIDMTEFYLHKIDALEVRQSVAARMLGYGDIILTASGGERRAVRNIGDPKECRAAFMQAVQYIQQNMNQNPTALNNPAN